ncbi:MAG: CHRD domain-containing protein [Bacteroidia bacterium]
MTKFTKSISLIIGLAISIQANASHLRDQILLTARMNGAQEVPAVITNAVGVTAFSLNATRDTMCVNMTVTGLSGTITGAHIHAGTTGVNGPVLFDLTGFIVGNSATATITGNDLTPALLSNYLKGMMYINVHNTANPNGEIRGQIIPESDVQYIANLDGAQETPPVTTNAFGIGTFALSKHNGKLLIRVVVDGMSGMIMGAHLHMGAVGVSGPVVVDLTSNISGNTVIASIDPTLILPDLIAGNIYLNLHTAANPNGEIRGQLFKDDKIAFDALLNGAQEVPVVTTSATGLANYKLNTTLDTLWYDVVLNGLAAQATGAHLHNGIVGIAGPVVYDMSADINGNRITGMATGAALTPLLNDMLKGNLYINVHNSVNPNGEIRGQVYRLLREGYSASVEGSQEIPPVTSAARGTLVASVDRNQTDLHFMVVADGLIANGVHFHNGAEGQSGPVIYDMTSQFVNNGAFGYWKSTDASPFTTANSLIFRNDSAYINLHTVANPNGEIRGQVERGFYCFSLTTGISENNLEVENFSTYPNPVNGILNISFNGKVKDNAKVIVTDVEGRQILSQNANVINGENKIAVDATAFSKGMYFVQITVSGKAAAFSKFIKE